MVGHRWDYSRVEESSGSGIDGKMKGRNEINGDILAG